MTRRVVVWATGTVGKHAIKGVDAHPDLELVGVWVSSAAKEGKDAGQLAELGRDLGVLATNDKQAIWDLKPDAIVHTAMTDDRVFESIEDLKDIVRHGINVVSSGPVVLCFPFQLGLDKQIAGIEEACAEGGASLHVNGIDPGFANDVLPLVGSSLCQRIDLLRVSEIADYSTYYQPVVMRDLFGFGKPLEDDALLWTPGILTMAWGPVVRALADGLGVELDPQLIEDVQKAPTDRDLETLSVNAAAGTMGAVKFTVTGTVDGTPRIVLEHVTRLAADLCPEWPQPAGGDGCYRIEYVGEPMMTIDLMHHGEFGDHNVSGMIITAQRLINAVPAVCDAEPGLVLAKDLMSVTGRGLVSR